jgi:hypothetical protein
MSHEYLGSIKMHGQDGYAYEHKERTNLFGLKDVVIAECDVLFIVGSVV